MTLSKIKHANYEKWDWIRYNVLYNYKLQIEGRESPVARPLRKVTDNCNCHNKDWNPLLLAIMSCSDFRVGNRDHTTIEAAYEKREASHKKTLFSLQ